MHLLHLVIEGKVRNEIKRTFLSREKDTYHDGERGKMTASQSCCETGVAESAGESQGLVRASTWRCSSKTICRQLQIC